MVFDIVELVGMVVAIVIAYLQLRGQIRETNAQVRELTNWVTVIRARDQSRSVTYENCHFHGTVMAAEAIRQQYQRGEEEA